MGATFALGVRACCVAVGLLLGTARAAAPVSPLVGQTRDQLLSRYGEPRSQMESGNRVIYYYPRERIVLRNNVVVEVEEFAGEPPAVHSAPPPPAPGTQNESAAPSTRSATPAPPPEPKFGIKLVRPPSPKDSRAPSEPVKATPVTPAPAVPTEPQTASTEPRLSTPASSAKKQAEEPAVPENQVLETSPKSPDASATSGPKKNAEAKMAAEARKAAEAKKAADELEAKKKKDEAIQAARRRAEQATAAEPAESVIGGRTYLLALIVVVGGAGVLFWRYRQRQLELAASSVEFTPLATSSSAPVFTGSIFTADALNQLEWKQFEDLVAAYYSKTGVIAVRTKTGPESPVHIKISWKGEPRPFAYVQCLPHPTGLIDVKPLHALVAALAADDIRRGYVVTSGKFNTPARDYAEEKHLTLLPGDLFLEKLNALPSSARSDIMQTVSAAGAADGQKA